MMYLDYEGKRYIFASYAGAPTHPMYHNLIANPDVTVEAGTETYEATASPSRWQSVIHHRSKPKICQLRRVRIEDDAKDPVVELVPKS